MSAALGRPTAAAIAVGLMVAGWVASVVIRSLHQVEVKIVEEVSGVGLAAALLYTKMSGRRDGSGPDEGAAS